MNNKKDVLVVHCVDTEGPLNESLKATFERIYSIFGLKFDPKEDTLNKLQNKKIDLGEITNSVAKALDPNLLKYNNSWDKIDEMLDELLSNEFRSQIPDSYGNKWVYNWHCMDHVGFNTNPRNRDMGFHNIYDHYVEKLSKESCKYDGLHFHHHPVPMSLAAHQPATHYFSHKPVIYEILARRIIERNWFPSVHRPGFHSTRPDSHWFFRTIYTI